MKKIKKINKKRIDYTEAILKFLAKNPQKKYNYKQISAAINVIESAGRNQVIKNLKQLSSEGKLLDDGRAKYSIVAKKEYLEGIVEITSRKTAFFICDELEQDIPIPLPNLNKALNGDKVEVYIYNKRKNKRPEAEVTKIIERKKTEFVGILQMHSKYAFLISANPRMYVDIFIPKEKIGDAQDGDVVLVKMNDWPKRANNPYGEVLKVLGKPGEMQTEMHAILSEYGLPTEFPIEVETYAQRLDVSISAEEISKRRDMREILTFTIDPKDAKDFDDALSYEKLPNGNHSIGIHIADVSHYVKEGTILDEEAYHRSTSIYLVDRVIPMLPEVLSNFACSLRPNEEKYTFSAVFEMNDRAEIVNQWFGRTVIYSDKRFAYDEAQHIIETQQNIIPKEISLTEQTQNVSQNIVDAILQMNVLAKQLKQKRLSAGAISFDKTEVKFILDNNDEPTSVYFKVSKDANFLIEEFMLLANRKVAEFIHKKEKTFVYRVHDDPNEDKLFNLQSVIKNFGYSLDFKNKKTISKSLNQLLCDVSGKKEQNMIDTLAIRSMSKAEYSTQNIGHYGLAFDYYSHFTSPIRRYPDIMAHRLLQHYLDGGNSVEEDPYEEKCNYCSHMESLAASAERDSIKYMQVKYMQSHQNKEFKGVVSGVTEWGIYVEIIENKCEGMVRLRDIKDDYYVFDESQYAIVGQESHNVIQLGDEVIVKVKNTDLVKKQLDFYLI